MNKSFKIVVCVLISINICYCNQLYSQKDGLLIFKFTNGFIYGKGDSLNFSGKISLKKDSLFFYLKDKATEKAKKFSLAISKIDHNKQEELAQLNDTIGVRYSILNLLKITNCNELMHIYTEDKSDWMFLFVNNLTYLIYHNNFTIINFNLSSGNYTSLKTLFPDK